MTDPCEQAVQGWKYSIEPPMVDPCRQTIEGENICKVTQGGLMKTSHRSVRKSHALVANGGVNNLF